MISGSNKTESDGRVDSYFLGGVVQPFNSANLEVHVVEHISRIADKNLPRLVSCSGFAERSKMLKPSDASSAWMRRLKEDWEILRLFAARVKLLDSSRAITS